MLFANLTQRLENFKVYGPPRIEKALMSVEDTRFAKQHLECGGELFHESNQEFGQDDDQLEEIQ